MLLHLLPSLPTFLSDCLHHLLLLPISHPPPPPLRRRPPPPPSPAPPPPSPPLPPLTLLPSLPPSLLPFLSASALHRCLASLLTHLLTSPSLSYPAISTALTPLPPSTLTQLLPLIERLLTHHTQGHDPLLPSLLYTLHTILRTSPSPSPSPAYLPFPIDPVTLARLDGVRGQGQGQGQALSVEGVGEMLAVVRSMRPSPAFLTLCREKGWVDWALFALALPALLLPSSPTPPAADRAPLVDLLSLFYAGVPMQGEGVGEGEGEGERVRAQLTSLLALADSAPSLPAFFASLPPATGALSAWELQLLLALIPRYPPVQSDTSAYLTALLSMTTQALPTLLYHALSVIDLFLSVPPCRDGPAPVRRAVCEAFAHALTCRASVPALPRTDPLTPTLRVHTKATLAALKQLANAQID